MLAGKLADGSFTTANRLCQMALFMARQRSEPVVDEKLVQSAYAFLVSEQSQVAAGGPPL
jgi:hypothetical protein